MFYPSKSRFITKNCQSSNFVLPLTLWLLADVLFKVRLVKLQTPLLHLPLISSCLYYLKKIYARKYIFLLTPYILGGTAVLKS